MISIPLPDIWAKDVFDSIAFTNNASGQPTKIEFKKGSAAVRTLDLTYDASGYLTNIATS